jgi:hypothetical protein
MQTAKLDLSSIPTPKRPMTEEEIGKSYLASMIVLPEVLQDIAASLSVMALYYEKQGIKEGLFTENDLTGGDNE